jgi:hypothetical protein
MTASRETGLSHLLITNTAMACLLQCGLRDLATSNEMYTELQASVRNFWQSRPQARLGLQGDLLVPCSQGPLAIAMLEPKPTTRGFMEIVATHNNRQ